MTKNKKKGDKPEIAGEFTDPHTGDTVVVYCKEGESADDAMKRVKTAHFRT